jgi:hypothetical protein
MYIPRTALALRALDAINKVIRSELVTHDGVACKLALNLEQAFELGDLVLARELCEVIEGLDLPARAPSTELELQIANVVNP